MFEFGDELIIDSYRIPWLIWIQLLAMFLLVILLYVFTTTPSDLSLHFSTATASSSAFQSASPLSRSFFTSAAEISNQNYKVSEHEINETGTSTSEVVQRANKPNIVRQMEGSTTMDEGNSMMLEHSYHPCHLFGLAKQAFLKCLGLDSGPENSTRKKHKEKDE
ncbi:hypothetical protein L2E82_34474 [Cichorium intybus]|uniref:Uncharacterized protein n=1 Tax=Cichorium intybus TaxID=13427 RepID=A0ACB9BM77_CICIN|nr:hypothetical protein L2E82_34474 [Cichorium intybus]